MLVRPWPLLMKYAATLSTVIQASFPGQLLFQSGTYDALRRCRPEVVLAAAIRRQTVGNQAEREKYNKNTKK